ncbi:hypothetical protein MMC07_006026 [Pseudocyphellaria aurata]|nr:hypothetical protein [Pseudocyphellaria aurata]
MNGRFFKTLIHIVKHVRYEEAVIEEFDILVAAPAVAPEDELCFEAAEVADPDEEAFEAAEVAEPEEAVELCFKVAEVAEPEEEVDSGVVEEVLAGAAVDEGQVAIDAEKISGDQECRCLRHGDESKSSEKTDLHKLVATSMVSIKLSEHAVFTQQEMLVIQSELPQIHL